MFHFAIKMFKTHYHAWNIDITVKASQGLSTSSVKTASVITLPITSCFIDEKWFFTVS